MKMFELLPRPLGSIFRKLTHFTCNSPMWLSRRILSVLFLPAARSRPCRPSAFPGRRRTNPWRGGPRCRWIRLGRVNRRGASARWIRLGRGPRRHGPRCSLRLCGLASRFWAMPRRPVADGRRRCVVAMVPVPDMPWRRRRWRRRRDINDCRFHGDRCHISVARRIAAPHIRRIGRVGGAVARSIALADAASPENPKCRECERCKQFVVVVHDACPSCRLSDI